MKNKEFKPSTENSYHDQYSDKQHKKLIKKLEQLKKQKKDAGDEAAANKIEKHINRLQSGEASEPQEE